MDLNKNIGTVDHPFANVDEAFDFILKAEKEAIASDAIVKYYNTKSDCFNSNGERVPDWLQPDTALVAKNYPEDAFMVTKQMPSNTFQFKPNLSKRKFLFRGQTQDYPTCKPGLFRNPDQDYFLNEMILQHEMWCLVDSHPLFKLLTNVGVNLNGYEFKMYTNYGGICQHYFNRTSFLDLTSSVEAAKFFACCDYNQKDDSYTPHTQDGVGVIYFYEIVMPMAFQKTPPGYAEPYYHLSTIGKQIFPRSGAQHGFLMDLSKGMDFNNLPFTHKVYFRHNAAIADRIYIKKQKGLEIMPPSILDDYWKAKLSSTRTDRTVSKAAVKVNLSYNRQETASSLTKKLKKRGYTVINSSPCFSDDQLNSYYQDIKNGWWQDEFCKNIYFYGEDGKPYQDAFRMLPTRDEYRPYFFK